MWRSRNYIFCTSAVPPVDNKFHRPGWCSNCNLPVATNVECVCVCVTSSDGIQKEATLHANEEDKVLHPRNILNQAICKHFTSLHYVSCLSHSVNIVLFKHDPKIFLKTRIVTPWRLRMKQNNWLVWKSHVRTLYWPTVRQLLCSFLHLGIWNLVKSPLIRTPIISNLFRCPWSKFRPWPAISLIRCARTLKPIPIDSV